MSQLSLDDVEIWLPVAGYELTYKISSLGRVWSAPRPSTRGGFLKLTPDKRGYLYVGLVQHGVQVRRYVHQMVAEAFIGPCPRGEEVRHLDGKPANCRLSNLTYATHAENMKDRKRHGTDHQVNKTHCPKRHEYDKANTIIHDGRRWCRECQRIAHERARERERLGIGSGETCSEPGCENPAIAKGLCRKDYTRQWRANRKSA